MAEPSSSSPVRVCSPLIQHPTAGIIKKLRLLNFMCHSHLETHFDNFLNFITGQNGSGKSAILTALCIAFGSRAKGTQRASTLKDFIKNGASDALVHVEIQNQGEDAFKPEKYGHLIIVQRKISQSSSSITLKDHQEGELSTTVSLLLSDYEVTCSNSGNILSTCKGLYATLRILALLSGGKTVSHGRADLQEIIEHFNIDVENPCVIMSQDKSREFLHSGNSKDKFKFFYKATLLQQVSDLLESISSEINIAAGIVEELEAAIRPIEKELREIEAKIRAMEHVEQISMQVQQLKKKLAWSWVFHVDRQLKVQNEKVEKLKSRIPSCQAKIDQQLRRIERLVENCSMKKDEIANMLEKTSQVKQLKENLSRSVSSATKEALELELDCKSKTSNVRKMEQQLRTLKQQMQDIREQHMKNTQAEEADMEEKLIVLQEEVRSAELDLKRLKEEEIMLSNSVQNIKDEIRKIADEIAAFGGHKVMNLLRIIERDHRRFKMPPIGPIGAHLKLLNGDKWALAVEHAIGRMLNSFIVADHKDLQLLKQCAKEAHYDNLQIIIYDFSRPRLMIPAHMLPDTNHPSIFSILQSDNHIVINVLVDLGNVERQVLVNDYNIGKVIAFEQRIHNLKEVYMANGSKCFSRGSVQTHIPPSKWIRTGRLRSSFEDQIKDLQIEASDEQKAANDGKSNKREAEIKLEELESKLKSIKRVCFNAEKSYSSKKLALDEAMHQQAVEKSSTPSSSVDELIEEISEVQKKIKDDKDLLEDLQHRRHEADGKAEDLKIKFSKLCESANGEIAALEKAEKELVEIEREMDLAKKDKDHYDGVMKNKVLPDIKEAEECYLNHMKTREENIKKASVICCERELDSLGGSDGSTPEQISAQYSESIDDLRMLYEKKLRKITRRQQVYQALRQKLEACKRALKLRRGKFQRNANYLKGQLSWKFNAHLRRKGISGLIKVSYEEKTLSIEVQMPQDASNRAVHDTRGLSGGERSFSTLCFALALHEMTEAPFRAMDEFDVFMDPVSRKISLDSVVDFATAHGSQWIFITPHDISLVKAGPRVKKLIMAAPRS
ncbi:hypothetical protein TanjilG_23333 [Lupinus angustifolius]|uniref:RecF/RecN/SMC N-terminal domain-containing protein n=1 Tax=Lupinus angustifolius TaxID=3871 RepID=A0A4P1R948_LUPAN|nr:hypothetical protein TanjilG_23333 [Lupinus angustifolius]